MMVTKEEDLLDKETDVTITTVAPSEGPEERGGVNSNRWDCATELVLVVFNVFFHCIGIYAYVYIFFYSSLFSI